MFAILAAAAAPLAHFAEGAMLAVSVYLASRRQDAAEKQ